MCRLTLVWVTSENSTKQLECWHLLTQSSSLDPILSATVSGVDRICLWFHANPLCCPVANCLPAPLTNQLSFMSPHHSRIRRDFRSKNPLSGFAPKQTKESSAWRATYIVLHGNMEYSSDSEHSDTTIVAGDDACKSEEDKQNSRPEPFKGVCSAAGFTSQRKTSVGTRDNILLESRPCERIKTVFYVPE